MDGTLVDSDAVVEALWRRFAEQVGVSETDLLAYAHGRQTADTLARFVEDAGEASRWLGWLERAALELVDGVMAVPGAADLLASAASVPIAIVTSAPRELAVRRLAAAGLPCPATLVAAEDVDRGKPDPAGYLRAAEALGVAVARCAVFEDAPAGIKAGLAAGAMVVEISGHGRGESGLVADRVIRDFRDLRVRQAEGPGVTIERAQ